MKADYLLLWVTSGVWWASAALFIGNFVRPAGWVKWTANQALYLGALLATIFLVHQSVSLGVRLPVTGLYQALFFFSWAMVLVYFLVTWKLRLDTFGLVLMPLISLLSLAALLFYKDDMPAIPYLEHRWFVVHVLAAFFAYASFALSFVSALFYLVEHRELKLKSARPFFYHKLPALEVLEAVVYRTIILGFPLLTVALLSGFFWTKEVFGVFWRWDPKFVLSILTWLIYLVILYVHYVSSFRGRRVVFISIIAFGFVIATFLGVNFIESSVHNFLR